MPERRIVQKARKDKRAGKSPTTQAGEFLDEEIRKVRRGQHGARSPPGRVADVEASWSEAAAAYDLSLPCTSAGGAVASAAVNFSRMRCAEGGCRPANWG